MSSRSGIMSSYSLGAAPLLHYNKLSGNCRSDLPPPVNLPFPAQHRRWSLADCSCEHRLLISPDEFAIPHPSKDSDSTHDIDAYTHTLSLCTSCHRPWTPSLYRTCENCRVRRQRQYQQQRQRRLSVRVLAELIDQDDQI